MTTDYRATVFLPATTFPMKADLPRREPEIMEHWRRISLYGLLRKHAAGRPKFVLHDGPPYANGHIHMGTALNKILKDVVNRSQQMLGHDAPYVPGWDCHGLPIEWQVEQAYRKKGRNKDEVPVVELRRECREFAARWIDVQRDEFRRLGVVGDFERPYTTMDYAAEAGIFRELAKFALNGSLYRGKRSVMWSPVEKTALAEAEVEYHDKTSTTIWVRFPVKEYADPKIADENAPEDLFTNCSAVIWTTTPWTIPGNRAIAYNSFVPYGIYKVGSVKEGSLARPGEKLILAVDRAASVKEDCGISELDLVCSIADTDDLLLFKCKHPLHASGYDFDVPLLAGDFVTTEQGTGLVHVAPSHGADDFELGHRHGLEVPDAVREDGTYAPDVPRFAGIHVYKADEPVLEALVEAGALLARGTLVHSYPHSWRSKAPLIFRATPQWFIALDDEHAIRARALAAIEATRWVPPSGEQRLHNMVATRPDWCVSRQRAWGVPIAVFVHKATGGVLRDPAVCERIAAAFEEEGADAWFAADPARFLGDAHDPADYEQVMDILDVWFESGSTHATVLRRREELAWPATLYLEGSDQHRGWFQSSLLEACGTVGRAPFAQVLTHGFVVDGRGEKMSKSKGNVVSPLDVMKTMGADILRLWVVSGDYSEDVRISDEILAGQADAYRRIRNTFRYLLGALDGFDPAERIDLAAMPELERWVLHRLAELDALVREANDAYDFQRLYNALHHFCAVDLSAFYFDVRKDALYCDAPDSTRRRAARTVFDRLFACLTAWLAPVLVFTAEEAWRTRFPAAESVHLRLFPEVPAAWRDDALAARWQRVRRVRRVVTGALEVERKEKRIGASLQAAPVVHLTAADEAALEGVDLAELAITSGLTVVVGPPPAGAFALDDVPGVGVLPRLAEGQKCQRCWQVLPEVGHGRQASDLCRRCEAVVFRAQAA